ncbi:MAG: DUF4290 domain-containing protein [Bacteroidia bacterium]|nr:DUF4290 domain-containing protein [Bacteroidia bacterium]
MHYHKQEKPILLREYGRNIQSLAQSLKQEPDIEIRTKLAYELVRIMAILSPAAKDSADYRSKLWNHLFQLCDYDLEVNAPFPLQKPNIDTSPQQRLPYYTGNSKMKQYGKNVEKMIELAVKMPDGPSKDAYVLLIANIMKQSLLAANQNLTDTSCDQLVKEHLALLSNSAIQYQEDVFLKPKKQTQNHYYKTNQRFNKPKSQSNHKNQSNKNNHRHRRPNNNQSNPFHKPTK